MDVVTSYQTGKKNNTVRTNCTPDHEGSLIDPARIPPELRTLNQWANWHGDKVIRNTRTGGNGSSTKRSTWGPFAQAYKADPHRLTFVFAPDGGLVGLDVDGCRNPETGELDTRVIDLLERFPDIYWEISLSGRGLHGIGYGELPEEQSGKHPQGIGVFHHSRYFVMTGKPLPGYETMGAYGNSLASWYIDQFTSPARTTPATPVSLTLEDHDIVERLRREQNGNSIAVPLISGDKRSYPDYSTARYALANKACFYSDDPDQIARILRSSGLFKNADRDRNRDRKAHQDATKALAEYTGPRYDPAYGTTPRLTAVPKTQPPDDADPETRSNSELRAELDAAHALIAQKDETIIVLQERIRRQDEREAIQRNKNLGSARPTAAALVNLFREEQPRDPHSSAGWRIPLKKLADRTGLSTDRCSDHLDLLATYKTPDGVPVLYKETRDIPRTVDQETGEIICEAHREVWVGPGLDPTEFGAVLATLAPNNAPKHGGAPDRNMCPDHPDAGVTRHSQNMRRITYKCACCRKVLDSDVIAVGRETTQYIPPVGSSGPIRHHAGLPDKAPNDTGEPAPHPIRHHAPSIDNHTQRDLSGMMRHSSPPVFDHPSSQTEPPWLWESVPDDPRGLSPDWQDEHNRIYGEIYREAVS